MKFKLKSPFRPTGDQPQAITELIRGINEQKPHQTLLGVTGSGKTFTIANLIQHTQKPTLIISHNKTLAAQLYQEFREFFPENAVSYFVSYYDYYQPEAYIPTTDTYIEKETQINDEIDKLRLSSTTNLLTRPDCIVIASVSCIYNLGSPVEYGKNILEIVTGQQVSRQSLMIRLTDLQYTRSDYDLRRGSFRTVGEHITLWPAYLDHALKLTLLDNYIESIVPIDPTNGQKINELSQPKKWVIYPAKHYLADPTTQQTAFEQINRDLKLRLAELKQQNKIVESYRLKQKVEYDLESIRELGFVNGIENYSRYFDGRQVGDPPFTLLDYFHYNAEKYSTGPFLTVIDESHITVPQIRGMFAGDKSRKQVLIDYGFRLPSALDNRPLTLPESLERLPQIIYTSATPNPWEIDQSAGVVIQQLIRPTGLLDPIIEVRPTTGQISDLTVEIIRRTTLNQRVLVTTLTKRMAEALTDHLNDPKKISRIIKHHHELSSAQPPKVQYLHADVETLERSEILTSLRKGEYDVVIGINLLREGLDLPEVSLVAILDADKEGFLRSKTSLVQTIGRAARHQEGRVIMYADKITDSMHFAIDETSRRRHIQTNYNQVHGLTPTSIDKPIRHQLIKGYVGKADSVQQNNSKSNEPLLTKSPDDMTPQDKISAIKLLTKRMKEAAKVWDFETAASLRDRIHTLQG